MPQRIVCKSYKKNFSSIETIRLIRRMRCSVRPSPLSRLVSFLDRPGALTSSRQPAAPYTTAVRGLGWHALPGVRRLVPMCVTLGAGCRFLFSTNLSQLRFAKHRKLVARKCGCQDHEDCQHNGNRGRPMRERSHQGGCLQQQPNIHHQR